MKPESLILIICFFFIINSYYDGYYTKQLLLWKKYYVMGMWGFLGISIYLFLKKNPYECKSVIHHANNMIQYMPIDNNSKDLLTPVMNITSNMFKNNNNQITPQFKRMMNSGYNNKRSVSESKKKYVASNQNWRCNNCSQQLTASYEVDHRIRLDQGGSNHVDNLVALCRNCHGEKTTVENL
jgi:5-methylcytosine-specific restriction endonuclease McrA